MASIRLLLSLFHFLLNFSAFSFPPASFLMLLILWAHVWQGTPYFHPSLLPSCLLPQYYSMSCTHNIHVFRCAPHVLSLLPCVPPLLSIPLPSLSPPPSSSCPPFFSFSSSFLSPSLSQDQLSLQFQGSSNAVYCVVCSSLALSKNFSGEIGCFCLLLLSTLAMTQQLNKYGTQKITQQHQQMSIPMYIFRLTY